MRVQKFEGLPITHQVFNAHSNNNNSFNKRVFFDIDSVDGAMLTDSLYDPILPQIVRKFEKAYNILFPAKVVREAKHIKNQIDELANDRRFNAVA